MAPHELANHPKLRSCELGSSSGFGSADALARLAALVAGGGSLGDVRVFASGVAIDAAVETAAAYSVDGRLMTPVAFTQLVRLVPELDLAIAYVTNTLGSRMAMHDPRRLALLAATVECPRG